MIQPINAIANGLICLGGTAFYIMLFTKIGAGVKHIERFGKTSYYTIKIALALVVSGALLNVLLLTAPPYSEVLMNVGMGVLFTWASLWHGRKFGVLTGVKSIDRKTGSFPVIK
jgi:hypothetical protein